MTNDETERVCCECGNPAIFGEPTCGNVECIESLRASMYEDVEDDDDDLLRDRPSHTVVPPEAA